MLTWNPCHAELDLAHRDLIRLSGNTHQLTCLSGLLWITLDGDARDILLEAGECFTIDGSAAAVLYALAPTRVAIGQHQQQAATAPPARHAAPGFWTPAQQGLAS